MSALPLDSTQQVLLARPVSERLVELGRENPRHAAAVRQAIRSISTAEGSPIRIDDTGAPPGAQYRAIASPLPEAPIVIYRQLIPAADKAEGWLVTSLLPPAEYLNYREAEEAGLLDDPVFRALLAVGVGRARRGC